MRGPVVLRQRGRGCGLQAQPRHRRDLPPSTSTCLKVACDPATAACKAAPVADGLLIACDEDDPCTAGEICSGGKCLGGADVCGCKTDAACAAQDDSDLCNGTMFCNKAAKPPKCELNPATLVTCPTVDDTACSGTQCEPKTGACKPVPAPDGKSCNDGTTCTSGEACKGGGCVAEANTCACQSDADCGGKDDGDLCNGTLYCDKSAGDGKTAVCKLNPATVVSCPSVDDTYCLGNICNPKSGACAMAPRNDGKTCSDGNPCTLNDACKAGTCQPGTFADPCQCQTDTDCAAQEDGDVCNGTLYCDKSAPPFVCKVNPKTVKSCTTAFDGPCAGALCDAKSGACLMQPKNSGLPCDDGQPCSKGDFCQNGGCVAGADICACKTDLDCLGKDDGNLCNGLPYCDNSALPWQCDSNPATVVTCKTLDDTSCRKAVCTAKTSICELIPINQGIACDVGSACTGLDVCKNGGCAGAGVDCDDGVPCTIDACDKATGCSHVVNAALCDDAKACTGDGCDPKAPGADAFGCAYVANAAPCQTDKPCQPLGACSALSCKPLPASMWSAVCDDKAAEVPAAIAAAADGSTFVVGRSAPPGGTAADGQVWLARVAAGGASTLFHKTLGGAGDDAGFAIAALVAPTLTPGAVAGPNDVLALLAGRRAAGSKGGADGYVARIAADGATLWQQHVGGAGDDMLRGLCALPDGQSAVAGRLGSGDAAVAMVARLDAQGTVLWSTALPLAGGKAGIAWAVDRHNGDKGAEAWLVGGGRKDATGVDGAAGRLVHLHADGKVAFDIGFGAAGDRHGDRQGDRRGGRRNGRPRHRARRLRL